MPLCQIFTECSHIILIATFAYSRNTKEGEHIFSSVGTLMWKKILHEAGQAQPTFAQWVLHYALKLMRLLTLIIHVLTKAAAGDTEWRLISWNRENWMHRRAWRMEYLSIFFLISLVYFPQGQQYKSLTPELFLKCACKFRATFPLWAVVCPGALTLLSAQICLLIEDVLETDR